MKKITLFLLLTFLFAGFAGNAKEPYRMSTTYEIKSAGNGQQGFYLVEVTTYVDKKADININVNRKCAVHGVLFKGFGSDQGFKSQKPMTDASVEQQHSDFFEAFFQSDCLNFATSVDPALKVVKVGSKYAVTATIQVAKDELRGAMERAGIVRKLGF